jgi:hypothetical protein
MRAMRAVSCLGPEESAPGTGAWAAGDVSVEDGGGAGDGGKASGEVNT